MSWLVDTLVTTAALIALVLVLRRPVARMFGPGLAYALWILPLLRLALPPLVLPAEPAATAIAPAQAGTVIEFTAAAPPTPAWSALAPLLQAVWLAGSLTFLAWRVWSYAAMRRRLLNGVRSVGEAGDVRLVESAAAHSPVAFGIIDKVVALPPGFIDRSDTSGRDLAIAHELEHHAGRDLAANLAMQPLLALHWFNPLAWAGWRAMRRDQEAACDARVLAGRDSATRIAYANLIASFAAAPRLSLAAPMACPVVAEKNIIYRLRSLTMTQPSPTKHRIGRLLLAGSVLALPLTASISYAAQDAPPAPPAAPAVPAAPGAPEAPAAPHRVQKIVIVESDNANDPSLHTRTVTRDGRTYVLRTRKPLTDAEAEQKVAELDKGMRVEGAMVMTHAGKPGEGPHVMVVGAGDSWGNVPAAPLGEGTQVREVRTVVVRHDGMGPLPEGAAPAEMHMAHCSQGKPVTAQVERRDGEKREQSRVVICSKGGSKAEALTGLRQARTRIAADTNMSAEAKAEVLRQLDAEIAKLEKEG